MAEVFLVAWRRLDDVPPELGQARAWLFGTARRTLMNAHRGSQRQEALAVRLAEHQNASRGVDPDLLARRLDLAAAWKHLSPVDQEALALTVWDGLTGPEAAAVLRISPIAYRLRLSRARRALRRRVDGETHPSPQAAEFVEGPRS